MRQCVILVGGKGTRLGSLTKNMPKPMLNVNGRPFLLLLLETIHRYGFEEILLLASHANSIIYDYFKDLTFKNCKIKIIVEDEPLGTGGALINAYDYLDSTFFCMNGDSLIDGNWLAINQKLDDNCSAVIALSKTENASRYGSIELKNDYVIKFDEKTISKSSNLINGGIYIFRKEIFKDFELSQMSLEKDIMPNLVKNNNVKGTIIDGYFIDIGTPESFKEANSRDWQKANKKAIIFDRDGTLNEDEGYTYKTSDLKWKNGAVELIKYLNNKNYFVFVVTNQAGIAKAIYEESDMHKFHNKMQDDLKNMGAHIDKFYFSPYHVDANLQKYKKDSDCRKPKTGMLKKIQSEWNISKENMFLIGDRETDIECANNFSIKSYLYNGHDNLLNIFLEKIHE
ncbi:MAG: hypothetical protein CMD72_00540 [Gammaproteobacteria bacterium]|nr:hypothetical protein [Gammaproteobacteria bacterium]|tara:strand:+ start:993 stop:2186 length:1194 start_codon:yes stop_codon:yes gene_type:complete